MTTHLRGQLQQEFTQAAEAVPKSWLVTLDDRWIGIKPDHCVYDKFPRPSVCLVHLYIGLGLMQVGYARGWL